MSGARAKYIASGALQAKDGGAHVPAALDKGLVTHPPAVALEDAAPAVGTLGRAVVRPPLLRALLRIHDKRGECRAHGADCKAHGARSVLPAGTLAQFDCPVRHGPQ